MCKRFYTLLSRRENKIIGTKNLKEHRSKIIRAIIVFIAQEVTSKSIISKHNFAISNRKNNVINKLVIFVLKT